MPVIHSLEIQEQPEEFEPEKMRKNSVRRSSRRHEAGHIVAAVDPGPAVDEAGITQARTGPAKPLLNPLLR